MHFFKTILTTIALGAFFTLAAPAPEIDTASEFAERAVAPDGQAVINVYSTSSCGGSVQSFSDVTGTFGGSDSSDSGDDNLPYPKPLTRASFLTPHFDPTTFLSSLQNRHQTLEDLRAELRSRSQDLNKELLDLVNENYQDFLSLGGSLQGGEEKIEEVRLGLLGFKRDVEGLKAKVNVKQKEVEGLVIGRKAIREQVQQGRALLDVDQRLRELEERLMILPKQPAAALEHGGASSDPSDSEEDTDEELSGGVPTSRLQRHAQQYLYVEKAMNKIGSDHPFCSKQQTRMIRLRNTILLDLGNALKQSMKSKDQARTLKILGIYREINEAEDAMAVLKQQNC